MSSRKLLAHMIVCATATLVFTGCVPPVTDTQDMNKDRAGYLSRNFDPSGLSAAVQAAVRKDATPSMFKKVVIVTENTFDKSDGTKETTRRVTTIFNKGNGFIQEMDESSNNGIDFAVHFELSYKGLAWLKRENFRLANATGSMPIEVKTIASFPQFDKTLDENSTYTFEYAFGTVPQLAFFTDMKTSYHTGSFYPASQISPKLSGRAIDLTVEDTTKGVISEKSKWTYLPEMGIAVVMESATSTTKITHKIVDITIEK